MARQRYELSALVLAETEFAPDKIVSERYGVSERSIQRWRVQAAEDKQLADLVAIKRNVLAAECTVEAAKTLRAQYRFQRRAARLADPKDPKVIRAIAGAQKVHQDGIAGKRILDARIGMLGSPDDGRPVPGNRPAIVAPVEFADDQDPPPDAD